MAIVVIGGHTRNIGKTSVMANLIAATPEKHWTAFKVTQFGHGVCSANGEPCACDTGDHTMAISEERLRGSGTDSSRYLAAGAQRSYWVRTRQGQLAEAMPRLRKLLGEAENSIVESNSILRFLQPDLFLSVLDPAESDFKASARRYLDRADGVVITGGNLDAACWNGVSPALIARASHFPAPSPLYCSDELITFVRSRLATLESKTKLPGS